MTSQSSDLRGQIYKCVFDREVKLKKPNVSATESLVYLSFILKAVHRKMFLFTNKHTVLHRHRLHHSLCAFAAANINLTNPPLNTHTVID